LPRIEILHDPELDRGGASKRHAVQVDAALRNGQTMSVTVEQRRGSIDHPLTATEAEQKFWRLAATSLHESEIDEVIELVRRIEREPGVERLMSLLTRSSARTS
jgi:2-methylcitrate dehydratase PrpD